MLVGNVRETTCAGTCAGRGRNDGLQEQRRSESAGCRAAADLEDVDKLRRIRLESRPAAIAGSEYSRHRRALIRGQWRRYNA